VREAVARYRATSPRIFGSVLRGQDHDGSDIDLLVDALPGATLFDLGGLQEELQSLLGLRVDVLTPGDRLPERIRAHAGICFLALVLHRVMRMRLRKASAEFSPARSLELLRRIQHHRINLNGTRIVRGLSKIDDLQARVMRALGVPQPDINTIDRQLELGL
jgi:predicted nucleotidyltransferase